VRWPYARATEIFTDPEEALAQARPADWASIRRGLRWPLFLGFLPGACLGFLFGLATTVDGNAGLELLLLALLGAGIFGAITAGITGLVAFGVLRTRSKRPYPKRPLW
jgi:hypothetical protein